MKKCHWTFPIYKVHCTLRSLPVYAWPLSLPAIFCSWCFVIGEKSGRERAWYEPLLFTFSSPFGPRFYSPPCTVWMAELANRVGVCILPDEGIIFTQHSCRAGFHTVGAIYKMGTLHAMVWALERNQETTCLWCLYIGLFRRKCKR